MKNKFKYILLLILIVVGYTISCLNFDTYSQKMFDNFKDQITSEPLDSLPTYLKTNRDIGKNKIKENDSNRMFIRFPNNNPKGKEKLCIKVIIRPFARTFFRKIAKDFNIIAISRMKKSVKENLNLSMFLKF